MSFLSKIFEFIKRLATRAGLNEFLKKYQATAIQVVEELAQVNSGKGFHEWQAQAFEKFKTLVDADANNIRDNWLAIALSLAYEVFRAEQEKGKA